MSKTKIKTFRFTSTSAVNKKDIIKYGVGMDVHKEKINVCISAKLQTDEIVTVQAHVFKNSPYGLNELTSFLRKYQPVSCYLMECTGIYHLPVYYKLKKAFPNSQEKVIAMNPLMLHRRTGDLGLHSDKTDAIGLANFSHYTKLIKPSYIGDISFFRLRELVRLHHRSKTNINRTKNRIISVLDAENFKFKLSVSKEWGLTLLDHFISKDWAFKEAYENLIIIRKKAGKGYAILEKRRQKVEEFSDFKLYETSRFILQMHLSTLLYLQGENTTFLLKAEQLVLKNQELRETYKKLIVIPSIGSLAALTILVEIGDYYRFSSWKKFVKYCGVVPIIKESGKSNIKGRLNRHTNKFLRKSLTQSAGVLINVSTKNNDLARYAHLQYRVKKMHYKKALLKVANKIAKTIYFILVLGVPYDPNHEYIEKRKKKIANTLQKKNSLLETYRTRALRRDIQDFLVLNYDFLNSTSKYHLKSGFNRVIRKSRWLDSQNNARRGKKKKFISKRDR